MTHPALPAGQPARRRTAFGLFDANGWPWAFVKALFWFVVIIVMLGYIPDRAYYFTVQRTVDIGLLAWSPVNLCPPENETLPCPAPAGASLPWHPGESQASLPAPRTDGAAAVIGQVFVYAGGSDGTAAQSDVYVTHGAGTGNIATWSTGPALPEPRSDAAAVVFGNTLYVIGGYDANGQPTTATYSLTVETDGTLGEWTPEPLLLLPEPRAGASAVAVSDGFVVLGGTDGIAPSRSVWKSQVDDATGKAGEWVAQEPLLEANVDGLAVHVGDIIHVIGGENADGPVATVQQGFIGGPNATPEDPNIVSAWRASPQTNLPVVRSNMAGFTANGVIYALGGTDGSTPQPQTWWATPDAEGVVEWHNLAANSLGDGLAGSAGLVAGPYGFLFGGTTPSGVTAGAARASLAPAEPFFQLGILGAVVPALQLQGEVGQQIGYLNAAGVGTVNFIILIVIGYLFAHPDKVRAIRSRLRRRKA